MDWSIVEGAGEPRSRHSPNPVNQRLRGKLILPDPKKILLFRNSSNTSGVRIKFRTPPKEYSMKKKDLITTNFGSDRSLSTLGRTRTNETQSRNMTDDFRGPLVSPLYKQRFSTRRCSEYGERGRDPEVPETQQTSLYGNTVKQKRKRWKRRQFFFSSFSFQDNYLFGSSHR